MKALRKALHRPSVACIVISLLVLAVILGIRAAGVLQRAELIVFDQFTRWQAMNWDYSGRLQKAQMDVADVQADPGFRLPADR